MRKIEILRKQKGSPYLKWRLLATIFLLLLSWTIAGCSNFSLTPLGAEKWNGRTLQGEVVEFSEKEEPVIVINFYSPTCQPCIEEIPAINQLYLDLKKNGIPLYLAVEGWPESSGVEVNPKASAEEVRNAIAGRVEKDVERYAIQVPVVIMDPSFRIEPGRGLITGTPETVILKTKPLRLKYNFIGPIATVESSAELATDARYRYTLDKVMESI